MLYGQELVISEFVAHVPLVDFRAVTIAVAAIPKKCPAGGKAPDYRCRDRPLFAAMGRSLDRVFASV